MLILEKLFSPFQNFALCHLALQKNELCEDQKFFGIVYENLKKIR